MRTLKKTGLAAYFVMVFCLVVQAQTSNLQLAMDQTSAARHEMEVTEQDMLQRQAKFFNEWQAAIKASKAAGDVEKTRKLVNLMVRELAEYEKTLVLDNPAPGNPSSYDGELQWVYTGTPLSGKQFAYQAETRATDKRSRMTSAQLQSPRCPAITYYNDATAQFQNCTTIMENFSNALKGFQEELDALK